MIPSIKKNLSNNLLLKVVALCIGYSVWSMLSSTRIIQKEITVPVCFYKTSAARTIYAPKTVTLLLEGKRSDFYRVALHELAAHIDASTLSEGKTPLMLTANQLFLPRSIKLVHYSPLPITVEHQKS